MAYFVVMVVDVLVLLLVVVVGHVYFMYVFMCTGIHVRECIQMSKPEVNFWDQSSGSTHPISFETVFLSGLALPCSARLASQHAPEVCLATPSQHGEYN